jgi:hypothetical protein
LKFVRAYKIQCNPYSAIFQSLEEIFEFQIILIILANQSSPTNLLS